MQTADLASVSADIERALKRRAAMLMAALLVLAALGLGLWLLLGSVIIRQGLEPQAQAKARVLADTIGDQIERAVGLGIPLERLVGVADYFDDILAADPDIAHLSLRDKDGKVLTWRGDAPPVEDRADGPLDTRQEIIVHGQSIGTLHAGVTQGFVTSHFLQASGRVALAVVVGLALVVQMLAVVLLLRLLRPLQVINTVMYDLAEGRFEKEIETGGAREITRLSTAINRTVARLNDQWEDLRHEAEDTRGAQIDKMVMANIDRVVARLRVRYRFAYGGVAARRRIVDALHLGLPLLLLVLSHALLAAQPEQNQVMGLFAFGSMVCLGLGGTRGIVDRLGRRRAMLVATILMAVGDATIMLCATQKIAPAAIGWAIAGLGMGVALAASLGESERRREATGSEWQLFTGLVASGVGIGLAGGSLMAPVLPAYVPAAIAIAACLLAALLIWVNLDDVRLREAQPQPVWRDPLVALRHPAGRWVVVWVGLGMGLAGAGLAMTLPYLATTGDLAVAYAGLLLGLTGWLATQPLAAWLDHVSHLAIGPLLAAILLALGVALLWLVPGQLADLGAAIALGLSLSLWSASCRSSLRRVEDVATLQPGAAAESTWLMALLGWAIGYALTSLSVGVQAGLLCLALAALVFALRPMAAPASFTGVGP